jgi:hypothetical protein
LAWRSAQDDAQIDHAATVPAMQAFVQFAVAQIVPSPGAGQKPA